MKKRSIKFFVLMLLLLQVSVISIFSCKRFGGGWPYPKKHSIESVYSANQRVFLQVYCEDEFDFQKAGSLSGDFTLSTWTDFDALRLEIVVPKLFAVDPDYDSKADAHLQLSAKVVFEWTGKDGVKKVVETKTYDNETSMGCLAIEYVPLPKNKKINYRISFDAGKYTPGYLCKGFEYNDEDKTADINTHPEKYPDFFKAKFLVVEGKRKGKVITHQKPAKN